MTDLHNGVPARRTLSRCLRSVRFVADSLVYGFIVVPGILLMMFILFSSRTGPAGLFLNEAEALIRHAPDAMVRGCAPETTAPLATHEEPLSHYGPAPVTNLKVCQPVLIPRAVWLTKQNALWFRLWAELGLLLSLVSGGLRWLLARRVRHTGLILPGSKS